MIFNSSLYQLIHTLETTNYYTTLKVKSITEPINVLFWFVYALKRTSCLNWWNNILMLVSFIWKEHGVEEPNSEDDKRNFCMILKIDFLTTVVAICLKALTQKKMRTNLKKTVLMTSITSTLRPSKSWNRKNNWIQLTIQESFSMILTPRMNLWKTLVILSWNCFLITRFKMMKNIWSKKTTNKFVNLTKLIFITRLASSNKAFKKCPQPWTQILAKLQIISNYCKKKGVTKSNLIFWNFNKSTMSWESNLKTNWVRKIKWRMLFQLKFDSK